MKDYLSRLIEYSSLIKEIEIAGKEHLSIIKQNPENYLKKAEEVKARIASDPFLSSEDKENMLKKISEYTKQVVSRRDEVEIGSFLAGILFTLLAKEGILEEVIEEMGKFFGGFYASSIHSQGDLKNFIRQTLRKVE